MLVITASIPGTLEAYAPVRPDASPTVAVYDENGSATVAALTSASRDSVSTTLSNGVQAGSWTLVVASASSITPGREYLLGTAASEATEMVLVREVSGTTITLAHQTLYRHAAGTGFVGTRITYSYASTIFTEAGQRYKAAFSWAVSSTAQPPLEVAFAVSTHSLRSALTVNDLRTADPALASHAGRGTDWAAVMLLARRELDADIGTRWRPWCLRGTTDEYTRAHLWRTLALIAEQYGRDWHPTADRWLKRYQHCLDHVATLDVVDRNEDNAIAPHEQGLRSGRIRFA